MYCCPGCRQCGLTRLVRKLFCAFAPFSPSLLLFPPFCTDLHSLKSELIAGWPLIRAVSVIVEHTSTRTPLCTFQLCTTLNTALCISTWCPMDHYSHHTTLTSTHRHLPPYKGCRTIPFLQFFWTLFNKPLTPYIP